MWKHSLPGCWLHDNATQLIENLKHCNVSGLAILGYCEPNGAQGELIIQYGINHPEHPGDYLDPSGLRYSINQDVIVTQQIL